MQDILLKKGMRIRARWFKAKPMGSFSISGVQMKAVGDLIEVAGTIRHVRGDHPTVPTVIRLYVEPDGEPHGDQCSKCNVQEVEIDPNWVVEVLK